MKKVIILVLICSFYLSSFCYSQQFDVGKAKEILIEAMPKMEAISNKLSEFTHNEAGKLTSQDILIAMQARSDIEVALEIITGVFYMYALQTTHSTTTPQANGVLIYYMESGINRMTVAQDRLLLISETLSNQFLKKQVKEAINYIVNSKYAISK